MGRLTRQRTMQRDQTIDSINCALDRLEQSCGPAEPQTEPIPTAISSPIPTAISSRPDGSSWFSEFGTMWHGQALSLQVEEVLHQERSQYQDVLVLKTVSYGNMLVLDGAIQATERDEFAYQEMITHVPMCCHPNPKRALVIGGGDGGVLRELAKHDSLEQIVICELDEAVPRVSKQFLPSMAIGFDDPRVQVHHMDGAVYMEQNEANFDVIIVDSSDPVGPASVLFEEPFYKKIRQALRPGGVACCQGECFWLHAGLIKPMIDFCKNLFNRVEYSSLVIPTYPCGQIGLLMSALDDTDPKEPRGWSHPSLRYYNNDVHRASFVLPEFARRAIHGEAPVKQTEWGY